eukprot:c26109_g1_i2 orf=541-1242(-)
MALAPSSANLVPIFVHSLSSSSFPGLRLCHSCILSPCARSLTSQRRICLLGRKRNDHAKLPLTLCEAFPDALLFDCDGVLVDTERDGHRVSFNDTFAERGLNVTWNVGLYGELLKIGGGKERMIAYFNQVGWPVGAPQDEKERNDFVASLHKRKTDRFMELIEKRSLPLRPGVARMVDDALSNGVKVAVCSTSNEKAVSAIVKVLLGSRQAESISIFAGDIVPHKKPDPVCSN